jgi:hypothetical protein
MESSSGAGFLFRYIIILYRPLRRHTDFRTLMLIKMEKHTFSGAFMVKKKAPAKARPSRREAVKNIPVKTDISSVEEETIKRASRTISAIEAFLAKWDASKVKPDDMFPQIAKIRQFHDTLVSWQKEALKTKGRTDEESSVKRLRELVLICRTYM